MRSKGYLSRVEPLSVAFVRPKGAPSHLVATVPFDGEPLTITTVHSSARLSYAGRRWWGHDPLLELASETAAAGGLLVGDLNTTERSASYRRIRDTGLTDAFRAAGSGPGFTFPTFGRYRGIPVPPIVRIDDVWHGPGWTTLHAEVTPPAASDHRGVLVVLTRE